MSIYEQIVSADANRCGSPMHNTRLQMSPARAETLKRIMESSDSRSKARTQNQSQVINVDDLDIDFVVKEDGVDE